MDVDVGAVLQVEVLQVGVLRLDLRSGGEEDADVVCQSSKCNSCPVCKGRKAG